MSLDTQEAPRPAGAPDVVADAFRPGFGIAVIAGGRDLRTPSPWVEGVVSPFDLGVAGHAPSLDAERLGRSIIAVETYSILKCC